MRGPGHGRAPSNGIGRAGRAEVGGSSEVRRSTEEGHLIEPVGGRREAGLEGFLEEVISELGTQGGVLQVRV